MSIVYGMHLSVWVSPIKKTLQHPKATPEKRSAFCAKLEEYKAEGRHLFSLDESGFAESMPLLHGYSAKGSRCFGTHDWGSQGENQCYRGFAFGCFIDTYPIPNQRQYVNLH